MATQQYLWEIACKSWPKLIEDKTINFHRASRIEQLQDHMALRAARIFETITKERAGHMKKRLR